MMEARRIGRMTKLGLTALLVTAALLAGCKKKKKAAAPVPSTPVQFTSTPGAVSENAPLTCDGFVVADSAKARSALAHLADGAAGKTPAGPDLGCLLAGALQGKKLADVIDATKAHALVEHGDFLPWSIEEAQSKPPHWSTSVTGASECQRLSKDGAAAYFCKIAGVYRLIQVENLGPGLTAPTN